MDENNNENMEWMKMEWMKKKIKMCKGLKWTKFFKR
jgi:hypothetical protein